ncbi:D-alanyl-D-alanine carboxypeptidase/D-alanyl-D-alanine-endopeptidase [Coleofasciculus sp. FACHB-64]|nr:D-alanyl-D-alanine carboxypeptidase/D-alanyl-D-alanine-endopeptidase [Coleofasciculus sp. FACHB-64]
MVSRFLKESISLSQHKETCSLKKTSLSIFSFFPRPYLFLKITKISKCLSFLLLLNTQLLSWQEAARANNPAVSPNPSINSKQVSQAEKPQSPALVCPAQLGNAIEAVTNRPEFSRTRWGILIEPLSTNSKFPERTLYSREPDRYFIPASNTKLLTTAAVLNKLGSQFRIRTSVYGTNGGELRVVGRGDPSFSDTQIRGLAQQLKRQGIRQVQQLIVEDDYFQGQAVNPSWEWGDLQAPYAAPVNSLILNQNATVLTLSPRSPGQPLQTAWIDPIALTQWRIENNTVTSEAKSPAAIAVSAVLGKPVLQIKGQLPAGAEPASLGVAVLDPAQYFLQHFRRALVIAGIPIAQSQVGSGRERGNERELAAVESPPLETLLMETNQNSNNLYAEALLRTLGAAGKGEETTLSENSAAMGLAAVKQALTELGVDPNSYVMADGSGLSRHNLVSPKALVQTLEAIAQTKEAAIYRASLPVAGVSGTLKSRFQNTPAQGIVQAKTGTMSGTVSLSGYMNHPEYQTIVFSILVNQSDQSAPTIRQAMDEIVLLLTRLRRC